MTQETQETGTLRIERTMKAPQKRIYNAFLDPFAQAKWSPPHGYVANYQIDARVGGQFRGTFRQIDTGEEHSFGGTYLELEEFTRMRWNDQFETEAENMQGTMEVTVTLEEVEGGTQVTIVQTGIPAAIPVEMAEAGWGQSMDLLQQLVEYDAA